MMISNDEKRVLEEGRRKEKKLKIYIKMKIM